MAHVIVYIILIPLAIGIDIFEFITNLLSEAIIGIILNIFLWIFDLIFIVLFYILTKTNFKSLRSMIILIQGLLESIPLIDFLPIRTIVTIFLALTHKDEE